MNLSYKTAQAAKKMLGLLPPGPQWHSTTLTIEGYQSLEPLTVFHRDAAECAEYLFNNPIFADHIDLVPVRHFNVKHERVLTDPISGVQAWETQVKLLIEQLHFRVNNQETSSVNFLKGRLD